jgi:hypothetical protein
VGVRVGLSASFAVKKKEAVKVVEAVEVVEAVKLMKGKFNKQTLRIPN